MGLKMIFCSRQGVNDNIDGTPKSSNSENSSDSE